MRMDTGAMQPKPADAASLIRPTLASMNKVILKSKNWVFINVFGIFFYLYFASKIWAPIGERHLEGGPGDPFIWVGTALPFLALCSLINIIWLVVIFFNARKGRGWQQVVIWFLVIAAWLGANRYDEYRQYNPGLLQNYGHSAPSAE